MTTTLDAYIGRINLVRRSGAGRWHAARLSGGSSVCGRDMGTRPDTSRATTTLRGIDCPDCRRIVREDETAEPSGEATR